MDSKLTPILKEFIEKEGERYSENVYSIYDLKGANASRIAMACGDGYAGFQSASELYLSRMKEFAEWSVDYRWIDQHQEWLAGDRKTYTTDQLLEKFIEYLTNKK